MDNNNDNKEQIIKPKTNKTLVFVWELAKIIVIAAVIVIPIRYYLFQPFFVRGESMDPNFENGDYLIIDEITYRFRDPQRGEVIVFKYPYDISQRFIKRVIGLPGETVAVKDGKITVYNESGSQVLNESNYLPGLATDGDVEVKLSGNQYFVLGDNRDFSYDSRRFGPISRTDIIGRVVFRAWPFASLSLFNAPIY